MKEVKMSLRAVRVNAGITTNQIAYMFNKSTVWVNYVETYKRNILAKDLFIWCDICGVSPAQIFLPYELPKRKLNNKKKTKRKERK